MDYPTSDSRPLQFPALFHPNEDDHFFVPHYSWSTPDTDRTNRVLRFTVTEYMANQPREEYGFDLPMEDGLLGDESLEQDSGILYMPERWSVTDDGLCMFSWIHTCEGRAGSFGPRICRYHLDHRLLGESDALEVILVLNFDMYTKEFSLRHYSDVDRADSEPHIWRDQVLVQTRRGHGHWNLSAITHWEKTKSKFTYFHYGTGSEIRRRKEPRGENSFIDYCWAGDQETNRNDFHWYNAVQGDDDFVVMFGNKGYTVFCFLKPEELEARRKELLEAPNIFG